MSTLFLSLFTVITANEMSALAAFLRSHISPFITGSFTLLATSAFLWDNSKGRDHAYNIIALIAKHKDPHESFMPALRLTNRHYEQEACTVETAISIRRLMD
jgi:hypothetical protein